MPVPLPARDGAADGAAPPLPPPEGIDGRLTAPPLPLREGGPDAGAAPGAGPGEPDGDPSMRPRGPALDRLGPMTGSERGVLGMPYERERDSDGSLRGPGSGSLPPTRDVAGWRSLPMRARGATTGAGTSSVAMRARGADVSERLLPTRDRGADGSAGSSTRERDEAD